MVMIKDRSGGDAFSAPKFLYDFAQRVKQKINFEDSECLIIYFGGTGTGKSHSAMELGYIIDNTLSIDRVNFDQTEFINAILNAQKGQVVIADEGISIAFSRAAMTKNNRLVMELMNQIRQKNLCVLMCVPDILSLDWMILNKANAVVYVSETRKLLNGRNVTVKGNQFWYIETRRKPMKTMLLRYLRIKRSNVMAKISKPKCWAKIMGNPIGETFKKAWYPVDEQAYRAKKESILHKFKKKEDVETPRMTKTRIVRDKAILLLKQYSGLKNIDIARMLQMPDNSISGALDDALSQEISTAIEKYPKLAQKLQNLPPKAEDSITE